MDRLRDERGLVGKLAIVWLLIAALLVVTVIDAVSIVSVRLHLSNIATNAASDGAAAFRINHDVAAACQIASVTVHGEDASLKLGKSFCDIDQTTGAVTITLHEEAKTLLVGRFGPTKKYAIVTDRETNGPSGV